MKKAATSKEGCRHANHPMMTQRGSEIKYQGAKGAAQGANLPVFFVLIWQCTDLASDRGELAWMKVTFLDVTLKSDSRGQIFEWREG